MIRQNHPGIVADARKYSCLFNCWALAAEKLRGKVWTAYDYNRIWRLAMEASIADYNPNWTGPLATTIITSDRNRDGDYDDVGEAEIQDHDALFKLLDVPLEYCHVGELALPTVIDRNGTTRYSKLIEPLGSGFWVVEHWVYRYGHFVKGNGTGKVLEWDPLGSSLTREKGRLESLRIARVV